MASVRSIAPLWRMLPCVKSRPAVIDLQLMMGVLLELVVACIKWLEEEEKVVRCRQWMLSIDEGDLFCIM